MVLRPRGGDGGGGAGCVQGSERTATATSDWSCGCRSAVAGFSATATAWKTPLAPCSVAQSNEIKHMSADRGGWVHGHVDRRRRGEIHRCRQQCAHLSATSCCTRSPSTQPPLFVYSSEWKTLTSGRVESVGGTVDDSIRFDSQRRRLFTLSFVCFFCGSSEISTLIIMHHCYASICG